MSNKRFKEWYFRIVSTIHLSKYLIATSHLF